MTERELTERECVLVEARHMIISARLDFYREALPLATDDRGFKLVRSIADAIGEISPAEAMAALRRELAVPQAAQE